MSVARAHVVWTYDDYRQLPDDGKRYEIIDGELFVSPSPTTTHQKVSKRLQFALMTQVENKGLGVVFDAPVDVIFGATCVVVPDLLVMDSTRKNRISERGIEGAPDLIVEILSPSTAKIDQGTKLKLYASEGVQEYWIVDAAACTIEVFGLRADGYHLDRTFGPGDTVVSSIFSIAIPTDDLFAP